MENFLLEPLPIYSSKAMITIPQAISKIRERNLSIQMNTRLCLIVVMMETILKIQIPRKEVIPYQMTRRRMMIRVRKAAKRTTLTISKKLMMMNLLT